MNKRNFLFIVSIFFTFPLSAVQVIQTRENPKSRAARTFTEEASKSFSSGFAKGFEDSNRQQQQLELLERERQIQLELLERQREIQLEILNRQRHIQK